MPEVDIGGRHVHYLHQGEGGPALVLLHAFPLRSAMWSPQLGALAATRVVAPDLLGFGGTDAPDDLSAYSVDIWADLVAGLLDHLGLERVILGGLSMGAYAAFAFHRRHRSRLAGLVLADTRPGPDTPEAAQRRRDQIRQLREGGRAELVETLLGGLLGEYTHDDGYSVTGGFVYRGLAIPGLEGAYVLGDLGTARLWALAVDDGGVAGRADLGAAVDEGTLVSFFEDTDGELYVISIGGTISRLDP